MRRWAAAMALLTSGCGGAGTPAVPQPSGHPLRIMSLNLCTDQLVLALLPPERITSVTFLAREPGSSLMHAAAMRVGANHGTIEEVIRDRPDLVIAGSFTTPATRALLRRLDYPLLELGEAGGFDDIRRLTRQVAAAVGEPARGEALIADMDRELAALARARGPAIRVAAWDRAGFGGGPGTLLAAIFAAAGARNIAAEPPASSHGAPDAEVLLAAAPDLLVQGSPHAAAPSLDDNGAQHRVLRRFWPPGRTLTVPQAYYVCGTPMIGRAATMLRDQLVAAEARPALPFEGMSR